MLDKRVVGFKAKVRLKQPKGTPSSIIKLLLAENPDGWVRLPEILPTRKKMRKHLSAQGFKREDTRLIRMTRKPFPGVALFFCVGKTDDGALDWRLATVVRQLRNPDRVNYLFGAARGKDLGVASTKTAREVFKNEAREMFESRCMAAGVPVGLFKGLRRKWMLADRINEVLHPWVHFDRNADYPHHHLSEIVVLTGPDVAPLFRTRRRSNQTAQELFDEVCKTYAEQCGLELGPQLTVSRTLRHAGVFLRRVWRKGPPPQEAETACRGRKRFPLYKPAYAAAMKSLSIGRGRMIVQPCPECKGFHLAKYRPGRDGQSAQPKV